MEIKDIYRRFLSCSSVCTDTRKLTRNSIYFALKGDNFDGNLFAEKANQDGAKYCVIDDKSIAKSDNFILVEDVLTTLQKLANYHRHQLKFPIISLTGSNGKTTTKELINAVLSSEYNVRATKGNLNNHIGVPLTLLSFSQDLDFGIVEMGANHQKEIEFLCGIAEPDFGLITNFGKAHLEGFGGVEGVIKGKSEIYDYLRDNNKTVFINTNDKKQIKQIGAYSKVITFGSVNNNDCIVTFNEANPFVSLRYDDSIINSRLIGDYNFGNLAVAIAIGQYFNVPTKKIKSAIENYQPDSNRSEIRQLNSNKIILDAYNANPTSMLAALKNFKQLKAKHKILFLGDMFELGEDSEKEHQSIVDYIETNFSDNVYLVGENFYQTLSNPLIKKFKTFQDLKQEVSALTIKNSAILIKGSRGMALERLLDFF